MHVVFAVLAAQATPTPTMTVDPESVTPGPVGFIVIAVLTLAVVALIWDMLRRIRRGRYRAEVNEELDAEEQARAATAASEVDDESVDPGREDPQPRL